MLLTSTQNQIPLNSFGTILSVYVRELQRARGMPTVRPRIFEWNPPYSPPTADIKAALEFWKNHPPSPAALPLQQASPPPHFHLTKSRWSAKRGLRATSFLILI
jgi:hypothetical protein